MSWLKIEIHTPTKPELGAIARSCKCSKADAFLGCFKFWAWADSVTETGQIDFLEPGDCDQHAGLLGFGKAMEHVGWIKFDTSGATITNFGRHCGKSAKRRALDAERKRTARASIE